MWLNQFEEQNNKYNNWFSNIGLQAMSSDIHHDFTEFYKWWSLFLSKLIVFGDQPQNISVESPVINMEELIVILCFHMKYYHGLGTQTPKLILVIFHEILTQGRFWHYQWKARPWLCRKHHTHQYIYFPTLRSQTVQVLGNHLFQVK